MVVVTLGARRAGKEADWLYRRYARDVERYARRVLRSGADADDVVQLTFVRALRALDRGVRVERPQNWLIKIAHNECRRLLSSRRPTVELPEDLTAEVDEPPISSEEFTRALKVLAPAQRQALVLRELEGRSYAEIAESMDLSPSAVETLLFRARRAVREQLELAVSCEEFPGLLESGERARVRAHVRVCESCAHLERQARGKKSRLSRIASSLFLPKWLAGLFATSATVAAVATTVVAAAPAAHRVPDVAPLQVDRVVPHLAVAATPKRAVAAKPKSVPGTRRVPGTSSTPLRRHFAPAEPTIPPGPEPLPVPEPTEPGPPPVPAPPTHSVPSPAHTPTPLPPVAVAPVVTQVAHVVAPVIETVDTTLQSVAPAVSASNAPVQAVQDAVAPVVADVSSRLPNVSAP